MFGAPACLRMERMTGQLCVDVVVDVPASRIEHPFTYLAGAAQTSLGARVRVPFRGRTVGGWVVSEPKIVSDPSSFKSIDSIDGAGSALDPSFVRLADWMRRRYACSFRA